jgi:hypothetical protein
VLPVYFDGGNSDSFHRLGRIHPRLRTIRLIHEMFHMRGTVVRVRIGQPIPASEIAGMDIPDLGRYLRSRCYALQAQCLPSMEKAARKPDAPLDEPLPPEQIRAEMDTLEERKLFEVGDYRAYLLDTAEAPVTMRELYRLREDAYYRQMVLWHTGNREIVGAYRLGFGPEIMAEHAGVPGFYSASLVRYGEKAPERLGKTLELGRSFIVQKYQREVHPLRLLLTGLAVSTLKSPSMEFYSGPVSISNDVPLFYKSLIVRYLEMNYPLEGAEKVALPSHPFTPDFLAVNPDDLLKPVMGNIDAFDRLLMALSDGKYRLPVLVRKYFSCGARLVCFNVDPDFSDSLDALIFLRYADFPQRTLRSVLRGLPEDLQNEVWTHFCGTSATL